MPWGHLATMGAPQTLCFMVVLCLYTLNEISMLFKNRVLSIKTEIAMGDEVSHGLAVSGSPLQLCCFYGDVLFFCNAFFVVEFISC
jgi:hypothetical protein